MVEFLRKFENRSIDYEIFYYMICLFYVAGWGHLLIYIPRVTHEVSDSTRDVTATSPRPGTQEGLGTTHEGGGYDQSIGPTFSDAIARSWLWSTVTRSSPFGLLQ